MTTLLKCIPESFHIYYAPNVVQNLPNSNHFLPVMHLWNDQNQFVESN